MPASDIAEAGAQNAAAVDGVVNSGDECGVVGGRDLYAVAAKFKQETGTTPMHFFNTVRLGRAQSLLLNGVSVDETAEQAGFSSTQYFCRCFKKTPEFLPELSATIRSGEWYRPGN